VRPRVVSGQGPLAFKGARHPLAERAMAGLGPGGADFVALDFFIASNANLQIVTAPNGAGKSTYLHTLAINVVLAHMGCYVPAMAASVRCMRQLFTRVGTGDSLEANASTFHCEMSEIAHILTSAGPESLVLVDELGRGTSHSEGAAICWAAAEALQRMDGVLTLLTSHFEEISELAERHPQVRAVHLQCDAAADGSLRPRYSVATGPLEFSGGYGIAAAVAAALPDGLLDDARSLRETIVKEAKKDHALRPQDLAMCQAADELSELAKAPLADAELARELQSRRQAWFEDAVPAY